MAEFDALEVLLWGRRVGILAWIDAEGLGEFQYDGDFIRTGFEVSPLKMPLSDRIYRFPEHRRSDTFLGLPGMIADSLTEKYGNQLMNRWLSAKGLSFSDLTPVERLGYIGKRGMGALEFQPDIDPRANESFNINISELVEVAKDVLAQHNHSGYILNDEDSFHKLIEISTSAGGAKAKALIAYNEVTGEVMSGQGESPEGFDHWLIKFSDVENSEHETDLDVGKLEYAYHLMAVEAGITMMDCRLIDDGKRSHFMTRRFDRIADSKFHVQTYCGIAHEDRNPVGNTSYETLFMTARKLHLGQESLDELYRRMVFNILARNQDDHSKNHAFLMDQTGAWGLAPAYDLTFSYRKDSRWISKQQMSCNGKRDNFTIEDLYASAKAADLKNPDRIINEVRSALRLWSGIADEVQLRKSQATAIKELFREI